MNRAIQYIGIIILLCCANIALALGSPELNKIQNEPNPNKDISHIEGEYNFTLFNFIKIKPELKEEKRKEMVKPKNTAIRPKD